MNLTKKEFLEILKYKMNDLNYILFQQQEKLLDLEQEILESKEEKFDFFGYLAKVDYRILKLKEILDNKPELMKEVPENFKMSKEMEILLSLLHGKTISGVVITKADHNKNFVELETDTESYIIQIKKENKTG